MTYVSRTITSTTAKVSLVFFTEGHVNTSEPVELFFEGVVPDNVILKKAKKELGDGSYVIVSKITKTDRYRMPTDVFVNNAEKVELGMEDNTNE